MINYRPLMEIFKDIAAFRKARGKRYSRDAVLALAGQPDVVTKATVQWLNGVSVMVVG